MARLALLRWHRAVALWAVLPLLAWASTGLLHPVMSRWQPSAVAREVPAALVNPPVGRAWQDMPAPARVLPASTVWQGARALTWQGQPWWQLQRPDGTLTYVHAETGAPAALTPPLVISLARHYTGATAAVRSVTPVTRFDDEYPAVNRHLPVWRVAFDRPDGLVAFIEPRSLQLAALTDAWKTRFSWLFTRVHSWSWWPHEPSRDAAMVTALALILSLVVSGLHRARATRAAGSGSPRWHRRLGWLVAYALLAWVVSGALHLLMIEKNRPAFATYPLQPRFQASQLRHAPPAGMPDGARLQLLATTAGPVWRWSLVTRAGAVHQGHHGHDAGQLREGSTDARTGRPMTLAAHLQDLVSGLAGTAPLLATEPVTAFDHEYGFVNKRLPVYRLALDTPDHLALYVDPADSAIAAVVHDRNRVEGFLFAYLHKASWLDALGKPMRDALLGLFAAAVLLVAALGLRLRVRRSALPDWR